MIGRKIVSKKTRMHAIVKALPKDDFGDAVLKKTIRSTKVILGPGVEDAGINNRQSEQEYIGLLINDKMIETRRDGRYRVTDAARTPGTILITVESKIRVPLVRDLLERAIEGIDGVKIIDEVQ